MKYIKFILIIIIMAGTLSPMAQVYAEPTPAATAGYQLLAPLPCTGTPETGCVNGELVAFDPKQKNNLGVYLNLMIKIFIGLCAVLSVVMITVGGMEYMTSELVHSKESGKERIRNALIGLLIALGAYALLFTINPDLLKSDLSTPSPASAPPTGRLVSPGLTPQSGPASQSNTNQPLIFRPGQ